MHVHVAELVHKVIRFCISLAGEVECSYNGQPQGNELHFQMHLRCLASSPRVVTIKRSIGVQLQNRSTLCGVSVQGKMTVGGVQPNVVAGVLRAAVTSRADGFNIVSGRS